MPDTNPIWFILIIIIIIIVLVVIWFLVIDREPGLEQDNDTPDRTPNQGNLNDTCSSDADCKSHLTCDTSQCKIPLGGQCRNVSECVGLATACSDGICVDTPLPGLGQNCSVDFPCQDGLTCQNNICRTTIGQQCLEDYHCPVGSAGCQNGVCISQISQLGQFCQPPATPCSSGLICESNLCKIPVNNPCQQDDDCISGHRCVTVELTSNQPDLSGLNRTDLTLNGQPLHNLTIKTSPLDQETNNSTINTSTINLCRPALNLGQLCDSHQQCSSGICGDSRLLQQELTGQMRTIHRFPNQTLIDIIPEGDNLLILLDDGNIMREVYNFRGANGLEMIKNNLKLDKLAVLGWPAEAIFYGLGQGRLYQLNPFNSTTNDWQWILVDWAPTGITHLSQTQDGNYLWLQHRMENAPASVPVPTTTMNNFQPGYYLRQQAKTDQPPSQYGSLYQYTGPNAPPFKLRNTVLPSQTIRNYGRNENCYLEIDLEAKQAIRLPKGDAITDYHVGVLRPDGQVFKIRTKNQFLVRDIRLINGTTYLITNRQCLNSANSTNLAKDLTQAGQIIKQ